MKDLYVSTTGSDLNDGTTPATAKATIQAAITAAVAGDVIHVAAGSYAENLNVSGKDGLTLLGAQHGVSAGVGAIRNAGTTSDESVVIGTITTGSGTSGWPDGLTIDGFRFENTSFVQAIRLKGNVIITNSIIHFTSTYFLISVGGNVGMERNLTMTNCNLTGQRGFSTDNARVLSLLVENNVFNTTAASLLSASALDNVATITNNEFNSPRAINILTNGNTIAGNTFNVTPGTDSRALDLYEVTGNIITGNTFGSGALSINVLPGGRSEASLGNTIENNAILGGIVNNLSKTVNAPCNWWGSPTGPTHVSNPGGTGSPVTDYVDFTPWAILSSPLGCDGSIGGTVSVVGGGGLAGVTVKLLDDTNAPLDEKLTDGAGDYGFGNLTLGTYNIMIVEPLGYTADANPKPAAVADATPVDVDFALTQVIVANNARKHSYWKHQFDVHVKGKGKFDETAAQLTSYIALVHQHYTPHFDIFTDRTTFEDWQDALSKDRDLPPHVDKAMQEIAALVMNFASLKVGQYTVVTDDGRTAGEVLTYVSQGGQ